MMEFKAKEAYSINFIFSEFYLPKNAKLYITNSGGTILYGPVTIENNSENEIFLTDLIQGDNATIYLFEPTQEQGKSRLTIRKAIQAYQNLFSSLYSDFGASDTCNNDIACFPDWDTESDALALVLLSNGEEMCSGSLLITTDYSFKPYFLSAFHCIDIGDPDILWYDDEDENDGFLDEYEKTEAENWLFRFQYKMSSCGGHITTTSVTYNGADFKSAWHYTDFALMEMDNSPLGDDRFSWLGWNRTGNNPSSGAGIHHPSGDAMKISFENNQFQLSNWNGTNNHWLLSFDDGVVEHVSSGSPIFDQNKRVVGQLHGNQNYTQYLSYCEQPRAEYGRFSLSWTGGGADTSRLSNWLDPVSSGAYTTNALRSPYISGPFLFCSAATFTLGNILPVDSIIWIPGPYLTITSGQNTAQCTVSAIGSGSSSMQVRLVTDIGNIILPSITLWVGSPPLFSINGPASILLNNTEHYIADVTYGELITYGVNYYDWTLTSKLQFESSHASQTDAYIKGITLGFGTISFYTTNCCGTSTSNFPVRVVSSVSLNIYPNPADSEITIQVEDGSKNDNLLDEVAVIEQRIDEEYIVTIYDSLGTLVYSNLFDNNMSEIKLDISGWQIGMYLVTVVNGNDKYSGSFIVE